MGGGVVSFILKTLYDTENFIYNIATNTIHILLVQNGKALLKQYSLEKIFDPNK